MGRQKFHIAILPLILVFRLSNTSKAQNSHPTNLPRHPLDPLTIQELNHVRAIITAYAANKSFSLSSVTLEEPPKCDVLSWRQGDPISPRKANVIAHLDKETFLTLIVDLELGKVVRAETSPFSGYPIPTMEEFEASVIAPFTSDEFNKSITGRGIDLADVVCIPYSPGWFGEDEEMRRITKVNCYVVGESVNFYMRPIEGLTAIVDLDTNQVVEVTDIGKHIPVPNPSNTDYRFSTQNNSQHNDHIKPINPMSMEQPKGPSYTVENGHLFKWANWEFHLKPDPRAGLIVSRAMVRDLGGGGELRSVMYKGMVSELFVPYMDPTESWYYKTYFDVGEYGFGLTAMSLDPLNDCPKNAHYMDGVFAAGDGKPYIRSNMICVFERFANDVAWRHTETAIVGQEIREVRPKVDLVARMVSTNGNYEYIVDWIFQTNGRIRIEVGVSGIAIGKGTLYKNIKEVPKEEDIYGTLVYENMIGVTHDHYLAFYLDMDVDGVDNSFEKVDIRRQETSPGESPRKSYLTTKRNVARTEKDAQIKLSLYEPSEFYIVNPNKETHVGNKIGYKLVPGANAASLLNLDDPSQKRAAFTNNQIWVTPYNRSEAWAGGLFTWQSHGDDTLATWSNRDRPIENKDIVLWYIVGFHHVTREEDFPVMPTISRGFDLEPVNFFERNPIIAAQPLSENDLPNCQAIGATQRHA